MTAVTLSPAGARRRIIQPPMAAAALPAPPGRLGDEPRHQQLVAGAPGARGVSARERGPAPARRAAARPRCAAGRRRRSSARASPDGSPRTPSSAPVSRSGDTGGMSGGRLVRLAGSAPTRPARSAKTSPSSSEFEARRLAPCTPVDATSPTAQSPGMAGAPLQIGLDPAHRVVQGRRHRHEVARRVEAVLREHRGDPRETGAELRHAAGVEPGAARRVGRGDRPRHDVARRQLAPRVGIQREAAARLVHQHRAGAAHRLGDQRGGIDARQLERGRMELEELDVAEPGAGPVGQGPAVGGGHPADWW